MGNLTHLPQPYTFHCARENCGQPIDLWDWDWSSRADPTGPLAPLCLITPLPWPLHKSRTISGGLAP